MIERSAYGAITLRTLIDVLAAIDPDTVTGFGFRDPHSDRGYYCELAVEPCGQRRIGDMHDELQGVLGKTLRGYKGGEFRMDGFVGVWLAAYGCVGEPITSLHLDLWCDKEPTWPPREVEG